MNKPRTFKANSYHSARDSRIACGATDRLRQWMHEGLRDLSHEGSVLAVGCEEAFLASQLTEYASSVTVLDSSGAEVGQLAQRFPEIAFMQHDPAKPLPFPDGAFDAIWCCQLLDRVFDPAATLRELHRVLAPGGRLLVTVPRQGTVRQVLRVLFGRGESFTPANPHVRDFTSRSLAKLAHAAGFQGAQVKAAGGRRLLGGKEPRRLLLKAKKSAAPVLLKPRRGRRTAEVFAGSEKSTWASRCHAA